ncbi:hypothetical protein OHB26_25915 [Nocardia sp. NBC_01503]|uniref:hypothetical protein n=1 Tax=Nocardia sp. NBC_01503 TaxID=2975997 RepID=UPI002E7BC757|nr:hypothetical protein [Nocardia sp. NBC_01503]WTL30365.1 hypothetical protein OHB26_25915 [Nocardia sp. NBC_01503]
MPGLAGYPQFEGPGAAQYGSEAVEPPPRLHPQSGAPVPPGGNPGQPGGYGSGPGGYAPQQGGYAPQSGAPQGGFAGQRSGPQGSYAPQQGSYAPQQGGYPSHQGGPQGGYPQQGAPQGYGQPGFPPGSAPGNMAPGSVPPGGAPTGPPPGAIDTPAAAYERLDVGHAVSYGWDRFRANPIPWVGMVLIGLIAWLVVTLLVNIVNVQSLSGVLLMFAVAALIVWLLQAAMIRGALYETDGTPPDFPAFFGFVNAGSVLLTALIVFLACLIAAALCFFPAVIVGILCMFSLHFVIDQEMNPVAAIKASAQLVIANALQIALLALTVVVITFVGALFCGIGLLIAGPVTAIAITYAYRFLTGRLVVQY